MRNTKMNYFSGDNERTGKYIRINRQEAEKTLCFISIVNRTKATK